MILAGTSAHGCCPHCSAPYERIIEPSPRSMGGTEGGSDTPASHKGSHFDRGKTADHQLGRSSSAVRTMNQSVGWQPTCDCSSSLKSQVSSLLPATVLDPFAGSGTTLQVAAELNRNYIGIELDEKNRRLCEIRLTRTDRTEGLNLNLRP